MRMIRALAIASVSLIAFTTPAMAQDAAAKDGEEAGFTDPEIVVAARRRDESVQDVPAVVNAVTGQDIQKLNIRSLEEVATVVPGLQLGSNTNGIGSTTTIRGVQYDVNASGDNGTVQYYYNDAPVSSGVVLQALYDVGQIEVLRGPQGTLKGRSSPSGSISITFRKPDLNEAGGAAQGTVTHKGGYNLNGAINVPIVEGKLGIRIAGLVSDDDGSRIRPYNNDDAELMNRTRAGRVSFRADPFDGVFLLDASYSTLDRHWIQYDQVQSVSLSGIDLPGLGINNPTGSAASPVAILAKDRVGVNQLPNDVRQKIKNYNINASLGFAGQRLYYVGNWNRQRFLSLEPADDAGLFTNPNGLQFGLNNQPIFPFRTVPLAQPTDSRANSDTHEIRLQNEERIAEMFDYVVGGLHYKQDAPTNFQQVGTIIANPALPGGQGVLLVPIQRFASAKESSLFGNLTVHIGEQTELSGGIRHIWYKTESGVRQCGTDFVGCAVNPALNRNLDKEATIYLASAKHEFTKDLMVYASYGTAWRPDTAFIGGPGAPFGGQVNFLSTPPETSKNIEAGVKSTWLDGRLRVNVTGFIQKFKNYPYRVPGANGLGVYNLDPSRGTVRGYNYVAGVPVTVKGIEGEISFDVADRWNISATAAYADGKIKNGVIPCNDLNGDGAPDVFLSPPGAAAVTAAYGTPAGAGTVANGVATCTVNMRANAAPPFVGTLQSEYALALGDNADAFVRGLFTYYGDSQGDPTNAYDNVKAYGLLNLYAGVRDPDGAWEITGYAKNITNTYRVTQRTSTRAFTNVNGVNNDSTNYFGITSTQPREFGITARLAFGSR